MLRTENASSAIAPVLTTALEPATGWRDRLDGHIAVLAPAAGQMAPSLINALEPNIGRPCLRHGRPVGGFSEREDTIAGALRIAGWSIAGISRFLGRSQSTVRARLSTLQGEA